MKAVITGANGFIGRHLAKYLVENDIDVSVVPRELLIDPENLKDYIAGSKSDYIFHLASYGNHFKQTDIHEIVTTNYIKMFLLLDSTKDIDYKAFINVSSSSVYGIKDKPMNIDMKLDPNTFYSATKAGAEYLARAYSKQYNKPIVSVRPFSVYGEGEADFRFIPTVIRSIMNDEVLTLSKGYHDWIYVEDIVKIMLDTAKNPIKEVVNMGTGNQYSNDYVVKQIEKIMGKKANITRIDGMRPDDSTVWRAEKTNRKYTSLKDGLEKTIEYEKQKAKEKNN